MILFEFTWQNNGASGCVQVRNTVKHFHIHILYHNIFVTLFEFKYLIKHIKTSITGSYNDNYYNKTGMTETNYNKLAGVING